MNLTRREKLIEVRKNIRNLIRLEAQKIVTLTNLDLAVEQLQARPDTWKENDPAIEEIRRMFP